MNVNELMGMFEDSTLVKVKYYEAGDYYDYEGTVGDFSCMQSTYEHTYVHVNQVKDNCLVIVYSWSPNSPRY